MVKFIIILVLLGSLWSTCRRPQMPAECQEFFSRPLDEHGKLVATYPLDKQLRLYRCGLARHPPEITLAVDIADSRKEQIPLLLERLESEKDEVLQYAIIDILEMMSLKGYLRNIPDVVNRVRQVVAKMKIPIFKEMAEKSLRKIEQNNTG